VTEPEVVFADEPTGALYTDTGRRLIDLLTGLAARTGIGLVVGAHDADVAAWCHRVVVLRDGRTDPVPVPAVVTGRPR
jgi:putative ABC transport system ATP-binding protein